MSNLTPLTASHSTLPTEQAERLFSRASASDFKKIPGSPVAYWVSDATKAAFIRLNPMDKGGGFKKWYGSNFSVVNWKMDGKEIKANICRKYSYLKGNPDFVAKNPNDYFKPGATWGKVSSGSFSCRVTQHGFIFSDAGSKIPVSDLETAKKT